MSGPIEALFAAQELLLERRPGSADAAFVLRELAEHVPPTSLAHFLRFVEQGQRGVAIVRNGACSECSTPVPLHVQEALAERAVAPICRRCECFLLSEAAAVRLSIAVERRTGARRRRMSAAGPILEARQVAFKYSGPEPDAPG